MSTPALRKVVRACVPPALMRPLSFWLVHYQTSRSPDRIYLKRLILPAVGKQGGRVLFVGCRSYTSHYPEILASHGAECWTIDIDPVTERWGAKGRHKVLDAQFVDQHFPSGFFDTVILSGVFGWGVDTESLQNTVLSAVGTVLKGNGLLVLGWNTDRCSDPASLSELRHFKHTDLNGDGHRSFEGSTHVFEFFTKHDTAPAPIPDA
jgi:SAM-dependent methyltransferase